MATTVVEDCFHNCDQGMTTDLMFQFFEYDDGSNVTVVQYGEEIICTHYSQLIIRAPTIRGVIYSRRREDRSPEFQIRPAQAAM